MVILIGLLIAGIGAGLAVGIFVGSRLLSSRRAGATAGDVINTFAVAALKKFIALKR